MFVEHDPALANVAQLMPILAVNVLGMQELQPEHLVERDHHFVALPHHSHELS